MIMHEAPSRVFIFIHVPLFIKMILNCKYYKNFPFFFTMHAIKKIRKLDLGLLFFKLLLTKIFKKTKNIILALSKFTF